jgi:lipoprotein NlpI
VLDPKYVDAYYNRGIAYALKGDHDRAIEDYDQAIQLDPRNGLARYNRASSYAAKGDYDSAIADYDKAIQTEPKEAGLYSGRGRAYFYKGKFGVAAADFLRGNELANDSYSMLWRYLALEHIGESGRGELESNAARLKNKDWPYPVIELYLGRRSPAELLSTATKAEERCEAQFYNGEWHLLHGDRARAVVGLQAAAHICPKTFIEYFGALAELKRLNL